MKRGLHRLLDGNTINSCIFPAVEVEGKSITTIEGIADGKGGLDPIEEALHPAWGHSNAGSGHPGDGSSLAKASRRDPETDRGGDWNGIVGNLCRGPVISRPSRPSRQQAGNDKLRSVECEDVDQNIGTPNSKVQIEGGGMEKLHQRWKTNPQAGKPQEEKVTGKAST